MRIRIFSFATLLFFAACCCGPIQAQQDSYTWSSDCASCETSILNPGWYSDGSGIVVEGIHGKHVAALAGLTWLESYFCVAVGFGLEGEGTLAINPRQAVSLETDSAVHMILYPVDHPDKRVIKGSIVEKKRLGDKTVNLKTGSTTGGYLVFPADNHASHVTIVIDVGGETFRFPFVRNPIARAKFETPNKDQSFTVTQQKPADSRGLSALPSTPTVSSVADGSHEEHTATRSNESEHAAASSRAAQLAECEGQLDNGIFPAYTCTAIIGYLAPTDKLLLGPFEDGAFIVLTRDADAKAISKTYYLPPRIRSEIALKSATQTVQDVQSMADKDPNGVFAGMLPQGRDLWLKLRDVYCYYYPNQQYVDLSGKMSTCSIQGSLPDDKIVENELSGAMTYKNNYHTFLEARVAENMRDKSASSSSLSLAHIPSAPASTASAEHGIDQPTCRENISFAIARGGRVDPLVPEFARKWISKNQRRYQGLCFSQTPISGAENYLLLFSTSQSAFNGIYPTVRTSTNTSTTPVSGRGTVTDTYGGMWNYTYDGTVTTTTTTTIQENLPYSDTSNTLYLNSYNQQGRVISEHWRTITTRQGGDGMNTLGYNLGASLGAIHFKEHLLKSAVEDVVRAAR